ncbi:hypothetical protein SDC9_197265 [bioreactor metagenome]|uniref:Uncharacterized protein n=1 Tax=bioreactor metagenome TaxID=1076179 RepID=A0A645IQU6_9ZZZZ
MIQETYEAFKEYYPDYLRELKKKGKLEKTPSQSSKKKIFELAKAGTVCGSDDILVWLYENDSDVLTPGMKIAIHKSKMEWALKVKRMCEEIPDRLPEEADMAEDQLQYMKLLGLPNEITLRNTGSKQASSLIDLLSSQKRRWREEFEVHPISDEEILEYRDFLRKQGM